MIPILAQVEYGPMAVRPGSTEMIIGMIVTFLIGIGIFIGLTKAPTRLRRPVVNGVTFLCGLFYILYWIWPKPVNAKPDDIPKGAVEGVGFWIKDTLPLFADIANIMTAFLLGLGIYSLGRIHLGRIAKRQADRQFSVVLVISMLSIIVIGYWDYIQRQQDTQSKLLDMQNWGPAQLAQNLLFDGFLQQMDSAMFSLIAFFILSAAYRAFRIRSVESTVMMASALLLMVSLLGLVVTYWNGGVAHLAQNMGVPKADASIGYSSYLHSLQISDMADWVKKNLQTPALRAVDFGIGLGALAMGLRLWLGLEKGGVTV